MIKLERGSAPTELNDRKRTELTEAFKNNGKERVWDQTYIRSALLSVSNAKCAYCESKLDEESKYMEVEHFYPKGTYPHLVVEWTNLLPSCKHCNTHKSDHDVGKEPIIDPSVTDPRKHLIFSNYRFKGRDDIGRQTEAVVGLNDLERCTTPRFKIGESTRTLVDILLEMLEKYRATNAVRTKNRICQGLRNLLREALPSAAYSATVATVMIQDQDFCSLMMGAKDLGLWDAEMEARYQAAAEIAYL